MSSRVLKNKINASNIFPFLDTELLKKNNLKYKSYRQVQRYILMKSIMTHNFHFGK